MNVASPYGSATRPGAVARLKSTTGGKSGRAMAALWQRYGPALEEELRSVVGVLQGDERLRSMIEYHLGWRGEDLRPAHLHGGKRSRALLCLLAAECVGGRREQILPVAAALEMVHNFSLVFDDIQDRSPLRRGRPTVWRLFGAEQAINVGAAMQVLVQQALLRLRRRGVSARRTQAVQEQFSLTMLGLCQGQVSDLELASGSREVPLDDYLWMIDHKTASLLGLAAAAGGLVTGVSPEKAVGLREFGRNLGMAYQILDDVHGIWSLAEDTGKEANDLANHKQTLPILHAFSQAELSPAERALKEKYLAREPLTDRELRALQRWLDRSGGRHAALGMVQAYYLAAMLALEGVPGCPERKQELVAVAETLLRVS